MGNRENRRFSRIVFKMEAELTVNERVTTFSQINNLSVGGCLFETTEDFEEGAACRFWLPLQSSDPGLGVEVFGEIVRCDGESVSVRFSRIDPDSLFILQNIIRYNAPDPDRVEDEISEHPGLV